MNLRSFVIIALIFLVTSFVTSCKDAEHLKTPDPELLESMRKGMELSYQQAGLDPATATNRRHKNTAYQLALHSLDEPEWRHEIAAQNPQVSAKLQAWGKNLVSRVQRQRQGFPIPGIMNILIKNETLSIDQQYLLLACIIKLQVDTDLGPEKIELQR